MRTFLTTSLLVLLNLSPELLANDIVDPCALSDDKFTCLQNEVNNLKESIELRIDYLSNQGPKGEKGEKGGQGEIGDTGARGDNINVLQTSLNLRSHIDTIKDFRTNTVEPYFVDNVYYPIIIQLGEAKDLRTRISMFNVNPDLMTGPNQVFNANGPVDLSFPVDSINLGSYIDEFIREEAGQNYRYTYVNSELVREHIGTGDGSHVSHNPCSIIGIVPGYCNYSDTQQLLTAISTGLYFTEFDTSILLDPPELEVEDNNPIVVSGLQYNFGFKLWDDFNDPLSQLTLDYITSTMSDIEEGLAESLLQTQAVTMAHISICTTLPHYVGPELNCAAEAAGYEATIAKLGEYIDIIDGFSTNTATQNRELIIEAVEEDAVFQSLMVTGFTTIYAQYRNGIITLTDEEQRAMDNYEVQLGKYLLAYQNQWKLEAQYMYEKYWSENPTYSFADLFASASTPDIAGDSKQLMVDRVMANQPEIISELYIAMQADGYDATAALPLFSVAFSTAATTLAVGSAAFTDAAIGSYVFTYSLGFTVDVVTKEITKNTVNALTYVKGFSANIGRATGVGIIISSAILIAMEGGEQAFAQGDKESRYNALMALDRDTVPVLSTFSDEQIANSIYGWLMLDLGLDAFE